MILKLKSVKGGMKKQNRKSAERCYIEKNVEFKFIRVMKEEEKT